MTQSDARAVVVRLTQAGTYDAAFEVTVGADGAWTAEGGTYVTRGRTSRRLSDRECVALARLVAAADGADAPGVPGGAAFETTLVAGDRTWRWAGPPPDGPLAALAAWLVAPA